MLGLDVLSWFVNIPQEWAVFLLSMLPITELRAAVPIGLTVYKLPVEKVWLLAVLGNMTPTLFILWLMPKLHDWVVNHHFLGPILTKKLKQAESKFSGQYFKYGAIALILFVGIPLPFTGAWSGSLACFVFKIEFKKALPLIFIGVCLAATVVTFITLFGGGIWRIFF